MRDGVRKFGPVRRTAGEAHTDAMDARRNLERRALTTTSATLGDGVALLRETFGELRDGTAEFYESQVAALLTYFKSAMPLNLISPELVRGFVRHRTVEVEEPVAGQNAVGAATVQHNLRALGRVFRLAMRAGLVDRNPVDLVERPRVRRQAVPERLTLEELEELLVVIRAASISGQPDAVPPDYDADVVRFFFATGVRLSEAAGILREDVGDGRLLVREGKRRPRELPIPGRLAALLRRLETRAGGRHLFPGETVKARRGFLKRRLAKWARKLQAPAIRPHALRHSCGTHLGRWGFREQVIGAVLGHAVGRSSIVFHYVAAHGPDVLEAMRALWELPPKSRRNLRLA